MTSHSYFSLFSNDSFNCCSLSVSDIESIESVELNSCILDGHQTHSIQAFDFKRISRIKDYLKTYPITSFVIKEAPSFLMDLRHLMSSYKFTHYVNQSARLMGSNMTESYVAKTPLRLVVSFFDLERCIIIYNKKKVDGVGVSLSLLFDDPNARYKTNTFEYNFILSNFLDNLCYVDGVRVMRNTPVSSATILNQFMDALTHYDKLVERYSGLLIEEDMFKPTPMPMDESNDLYNQYKAVMASPNYTMYKYNFNEPITVKLSTGTIKIT